MERKKGCKIRKRGGSSSSSSSLARRNRFKRAIFSGKRASQDDGGGGGSGTPVKSIAAAKTPVILSLSPEQLPIDQFQKSSVSARKLAASLWEISDGTDPPVNSNRYCLKSKKPSRNRAKKSTEISSHDFPPKPEVRACFSFKFLCFFLFFFSQLRSLDNENFIRESISRRKK